MSVQVRAEGLTKVFTTPPPVGARARGLGGPARRARGEKRDHRVVALDGLTLDVRAGEVFGLLGPNGAGKSTTVGVFTTRILPTGGEAWVGPHNVVRDRTAVKRLIGVVPQMPNLDHALTAREILTFHGAYFGMPARARSRRATELLERLQLSDRADQLPTAFSGGMRQRLSIARALMHGPQVLFLDEPSAGLDPQTRLLLWEMVRECNAGGMTVLLTTHNMEEADQLSQRLAIVDHGKVIALGTPAELKRSVPGGFVVRLQFASGADVVADRLRALPGVTEVRAPAVGQVHLYADRGGALIPGIVEAAGAAQATIQDVHISEPSLENLFLHHTGRSLRE